MRRALLRLVLVALGMPALVACETEGNLGRNLPCPGGVRCPTSTGSWACVDLERDNANCGTCGTACASVERCAGGICVHMRCVPDATRCETDDVLRCQSDGLTERRERCSTGERCVGGACVLPRISWPESYRMAAAMRPAIDRAGWSEAHGECGANGPSDAREVARVWEVSSDWGALWRTVGESAGFVVVRARIEVPEAVNGFMQARFFGLASGGMADDFGGIALGVGAGSVRVVDGSGTRLEATPFDHARWHDVQVERDPSGTRVRLTLDGVVRYEGTLSPGLQGPAMVFRVGSSVCPGTSMRVDTVAVGSAL